MAAVHESRDMPMEWLRLVYEVAAGTPAEPLERAVAEACRRHRAQPRDIAVDLLPAGGVDARASLTVTTPIPVSRDGRAREALLRDIETVLARGVPGAWRRMPCDDGPADGR